MALTKIQPANLDSANDFSSLVTSVFLLANSAYQTANTASTNYFPTGDYGSVVPAASTLDEETVVRYDLKTEPSTPANYFLEWDFGPL